MAIGLGTYALFWEWSARNPEPVSLAGMLDRTRQLGLGVFQICDYPAIEEFTPAQLAETRTRAAELGISLELGTRGVRRDHLLAYLDIADALGCRLLRSMVQCGPGTPTLEESRGLVAGIVPELERRDIRLALETYEQISTDDLLGVVAAANSERVGICLDPGNTVAGLENPMDVVRRCAARVLNVHVKDFAFSRRDGWVGFTFAGAPLGEGLLDYDQMTALVRPDDRAINQIIEHWLPWQGDIETTIAVERQWTEANVARLLGRS